VILLRKLTATTAILLILTSISLTYAIPSGGVYPPTFTKQTNFGYTEWYDSWGYNRNYYAGNDGFLPNLAYESIGTYKELAYTLGEQFKTEYPNKIRRAEEIFDYVQTWTDYGYDEDNVYMGGEPQPEWAWNADEMAHMIDQTTLTVAIGDCEDMTFLSSTLYLAAGFDVAIVSPPEHVALMIYLPEYENANYYWDIEDDGKDYGWIWVEATSETNPLGWTPPDFIDGDFEVFLLDYSTTLQVTYTPRYPEAEEQVTITASVSLQNSIVNQVQLHYTINSGSIRTATMALQGSSYKATIPGQTDGTEVKFYVTATDTEGNITESNEYSYTVGGNTIWIPDIPGFPPESIIIGFIIALLVISFLARKKQ
jgi:hypothetical protein